MVQQPIDPSDIARTLMASADISTAVKELWRALEESNDEATPRAASPSPSVAKDATLDEKSNDSSDGNVLTCSYIYFVFFIVLLSPQHFAILQPQPGRKGQCTVMHQYVLIVCLAHSLVNCSLSSTCTDKCACVCACRVPVFVCLRTCICTL